MGTSRLSGRAPLCRASLCLPLIHCHDLSDGPDANGKPSRCRVHGRHDTGHNSARPAARSPRKSGTGRSIHAALYDAHQRPARPNHVILSAATGKAVTPHVHGTRDTLPYVADARAGRRKGRMYAFRMLSKPFSRQDGKRRYQPKREGTENGDMRLNTVFIDQNAMFAG